MSDPVRHHFLPEFYQKPWSVEGKVKVFRRRYASLSVLSKAPKATGWRNNLYASEEIQGIDPNFIEREVLKRIDNDAACALRFLEAYSHGPTDQRLNSAWTRFLLTLLHRSPAQIAEIRKTIPEHAPKIFEDVRKSFPHVSDEAIRLYWRQSGLTREHIKVYCRAYFPLVM